MCSCGSVGRCLSLRGGTLGLTRRVWEGARGEFGWAGGLRHAARSSGRRQAAGGRRQGGLLTKLVQVEAVLAQVELHVRPVVAVHHGYVLRVGSWWRWSVAEHYLPRRAKHTSEAAETASSYDDEDEDGEHAAQARYITLEGRYLERVEQSRRAKFQFSKSSSVESHGGVLRGVSELEEGGRAGGQMEGGARGRWRGGRAFNVFPGPLLRASY